MRHIFVTGGSSGIGEAVVDKFARLGSKVSFCYTNKEKKAELTDKIKKKYANMVFPILGDVRLRKDVTAMFNEAKKEHGEIDVLVNCAGIYPSNPILQVSDAEWDSVMDINLRGTFLCSQAAVFDMLKREQGWIVNITSIDGRAPGPNNAVYSASKAGVISLTRSFAAEFSSRGINVNAVAPGWVGTQNIYSNDRWKTAVEKIPVGRLAKPSEIADLVYFLCAEESKYITGEVVNINGGMLMD